MFFFRLTLTSVLLLISLQGMAQLQRPQVLNLKQCIDIANQNNLDVKDTRQQVRSNQLAMHQAQANRLPSVNANTRVSYSVGRSINDFTNQFIEDPVTSQTYGLNANVVLFNNLSQHYQVKQSELDLSASQTRVKRTQYDVALQVTQAYAQILFDREILANAELTLASTVLQLDRTRKQVDAGVLPAADLLQLEAQRASNEVAVIDAENNLDLSKLRLKQLMIIPAGDAIEIVVPEVNVEENTLEQLSSTSIYDEALQFQPSVRFARYQIESARYGIEIARADSYPTLSAFGGIGSRYSSVAPDVIPDGRDENGNPQFKETTYFNQLDFNFNRFIGLQLNVPIFNNLQVRSAVGNARVRLERARINEERIRNDLRQTIEQAYLDASLARKRYAGTQEQVKALEASFENTKKRFNLGATDAITYNQEQNSLNAARTDLIRNKYNLYLRRKLLDFYRGKGINTEQQ
jgi:outer membrane protein